MRQNNPPHSDVSERSQSLDYFTRHFVALHLQVYSNLMTQMQCRLCLFLNCRAFTCFHLNVLSTLPPTLSHVLRVRKGEGDFHKGLYIDPSHNVCARLRIAQWIDSVYICLMFLFQDFSCCPSPKCIYRNGKHVTDYEISSYKLCSPLSNIFCHIAINVTMQPRPPSC